MIDLSSPSVVVLAGPSGAGKSTYADTYFPDVVPVSADHLRELLFDDPSHQANPGLVFSFVREIVNARLSEQKLTVVDSTAPDRRSRKPYLALARDHEVPCHLVVISATLEQCLQAQRHRQDASIRWVPDHSVKRHIHQQDRLLADIESGEIQNEGFDSVMVIARDGSITSYAHGRPRAAA